MQYIERDWLQGDILSLQHITLPFIPDLKFILYRGLVFLPFAALIGIALYRRPTLFPYFAILHGVMDLGTAVMFVVKNLDYHDQATQ